MMASGSNVDAKAPVAAPRSPPYNAARHISACHMSDIYVAEEFIVMAQAPTVRAPRSLDALLSHRGRDLPSPRVGDPRDSAGLISFSFGFPDLASLPVEEVIDATARALRDDGAWALQYGKSTGYPGLVEQLRRKLERDQGITASPENILITAGGSQALQLVLDLLVDWGDTVITEAPTWLGAVFAFKNLGVNVVSIPVDDQGTDTAALEQELQRLQGEGIAPKFIYVISNFQNPSGISTTLKRRQRLVALAQEYGTLILEDDAYHDLRYSGDPIPPVYTLDDSGSTMYLGTFSKTMGAGMRLGWLVAAPEIITKLSVLKIDGSTNVFGAHVAAAWIPEHLDTHVARLRETYRHRRDLMLAALDRHMPPGTVWTRPDGGFFIWVTFPAGVDTNRMLLQARERGVEFLPGATCYADGRGIDQLRLSFSFATDDQIEPGIKILGEIAHGELLEDGRP
jgi:2-aminoadipate transaminase